MEVEKITLIEEKITLIKEKIKYYMSDDIDIDENLIDVLYDLWINDIILDRPNDDDYNHHLGVYYGYIRQNETKMKKYLKPLVKKGNPNVIDDLAYYYSYIGNHSKTSKYFKILIKNGNISSMHNLAVHYDNYDIITKAIKYYKMAAEYGFKESGLALANYYNGEKKYQNALYYYLLCDDFNRIPYILDYIIESKKKLGLYFDQSLPLLNKIKDKIILPPVIRKLVDIYDKYQILQHDIVHYAPNFDGYIESKNEFTNLVRRT